MNDKWSISPKWLIRGFFYERCIYSVCGAEHESTLNNLYMLNCVWSLRNNLDRKLNVIVHVPPKLTLKLNSCFSSTMWHKHQKSEAATGETIQTGSQRCWINLLIFISFLSNSNMITCLTSLNKEHVLMIKVQLIKTIQKHQRCKKTQTTFSESSSRWSYNKLDDHRSLTAPQRFTHFFNVIDFVLLLLTGSQ